MIFNQMSLMIGLRLNNREVFYKNNIQKNKNNLLILGNLRQK
jgi:hypothetical protein